MSKASNGTLRIDMRPSMLKCPFYNFQSMPLHHIGVLYNVFTLIGKRNYSIDVLSPFPACFGEKDKICSIPILAWRNVVVMRKEKESVFCYSTKLPPKSILMVSTSYTKIFKHGDWKRNKLNFARMEMHWHWIENAVRTCIYVEVSIICQGVRHLLYDISYLTQR